LVAARALAGVEDPADVEAVGRACATIRVAVETAPIPAALADQVVDAYDELCYRRLEVNAPVAVRSSATGEDAADASFAGQFDTYLGVTGRKAVLDAVRRCWGSLFTERALGYRLARGLSHTDCPMGVGVIELVHARSSGVAFSIHPVSGRHDRMVIEGSWGWGEAVVQGLVTPDHIEVDKADGRVLRYDVAAKKVVSAFDYARGLVVELDMPRRLVDAAVLDSEQVAAIAEAVLTIEAHYGYPVDVEWVLDRQRRPGEPITIVQSRPETVHAARGQRSDILTWDPVAYAKKYAFGGDPRGHGDPGSPASAPSRD
jgi:pyruvate,water dikinase